VSHPEGVGFEPSTKNVNRSQGAGLETLLALSTSARNGLTIAFITRPELKFSRSLLKSTEVDFRFLEIFIPFLCEAAPNLFLNFLFLGALGVLGGSFFIYCTMGASSYTIGISHLQMTFAISKELQFLVGHKFCEYAVLKGSTTDKRQKASYRHYLWI
jgi:hypothetical protein